MKKYNLIIFISVIVKNKEQLLYFIIIAQIFNVYLQYSRGMQRIDNGGGIIEKFLFL